MEKDRLLDICWELFQQLDNTTSPFVAQACAELVIEEDFDINSLPEDIYNNVHEILKARALDTWATDKAETKEVLYA